MPAPVATLRPSSRADEPAELIRGHVGAAPAAVARAFFELTKPRVVAMILVTTAVGYYVGSHGVFDWWRFAATLVGTALAAGGTLALNQYLERDADACMVRTQQRPLPSGRVRPRGALVFGAAVTAIGLVELTVFVNGGSGLVTAVTAASYLGMYTPLKRRTPLCAIVGAVPGALPPVTGWVAATDGFGAGAWALFAILFVWQLPHSLAIAQLYAADYARAGFRLLPLVDGGGGMTQRQIALDSAALLVVGVVPTLLGLAGVWYLVTALVSGAAMLACGLALLVRPSEAAARRVVLASILYLPVLLACMAWDKVPV